MPRRTISYEPESLIRIMPFVAQAYRDVLGMDVYATIAQGVNEYEDITHRSVAGNHVSLNSLGLLFAQLLAIDSPVRSAIHAKAHPPAELYLDEHFYHSLCFTYGFAKDELPHGACSAPLTSTPMNYIYADRATILGNLDSTPLPGQPKRKT